MPRRRLFAPWVLTLGTIAALAAGAGVGVGISHWSSAHAFSWLSPSYVQPRDEGAAAQRAIGLLVGETRATDGMTYDAWYRARLNKAAPGIDFEYRALLDGNDYCGFWSVYAEVIPGPARGPANTIAVLNDEGTVGTVDETSGDVAGLDKRSSGGAAYDIQTGCALQPHPVPPTWFDEFRAGASP